ncbi:MAG: DegT/DnrJ/EryC1/StrS aminotransferase family protein [Elusimicrobia bacterium]|nr:DegT/DnrJ/EryC1/StrS aminotransferase family protein [Elusimicrobiota bacterium]
MSDLIARIKIPLFDEQLDNVTEAIRFGHLAIGPHLQLLKRQLSRLFSKQHVVLTANGFSALFVALKSATQHPWKWNVLTSPASTCFAITNAIKAAGHSTCYDDMDMASASLARPTRGGRSRIAVVPDHFGAIAPACVKWKSRDGLLIEDAAQSFISRSHLKTAADIIVLSFFPTKLINGIDGGAILTNDATFYARAKDLCSYSDQRKASDSPRYNLRMNNISAAFALGTLSHLGEIAQAMNASFHALSEVLFKRGIKHLEMRRNEVPSRLLVFAEDAKQKKRWTHKLLTAGVPGCSELIFVCPQNQIPKYPKARQLVETTFSIPLHPALSHADMAKIKSAIERL